MTLHWLDPMPGERCRKCESPAVAAAHTNRDGRANRIAVCRVHASELEREEAAKKRG